MVHGDRNGWDNMAKREWWKTFRVRRVGTGSTSLETDWYWGPCSSHIHKTISSARCLVMLRKFVLFPGAPQLQSLEYWWRRRSESGGPNSILPVDWQIGTRGGHAGRKRETDGLEMP